jgi:hypothetical protein
VQIKLEGSVFCIETRNWRRGRIHTSTSLMCFRRGKCYFGVLSTSLWSHSYCIMKQNSWRYTLKAFRWNSLSDVYFKGGEVISLVKLRCAIPVLITFTISLPFVFSLPSPCYFLIFTSFFLSLVVPISLNGLCAYSTTSLETRLCTKHYSLNIYATNIPAVITMSGCSLLNRSKTASSNTARIQNYRL